MMAAFTSERDHVLESDVESAIEELRWPEYADRQAPASATPAEGQSGADGGDTGRFKAGATGARRGPELYVGPDATGQQEKVPETPLARLVIVSEGRTLGELPLKAGRTIIGRTPDNDLQIDSRFVSRHHCQIITKANNCIVEDLNSTNGIVVKSKRVRRHNLNDGDVITIGKHDLIYIDERVTRTGQTGNHPAAASPGDAEHGETQVL
jgi:hypothetical protein